MPVKICLVGAGHMGRIHDRSCPYERCYLDLYRRCESRAGRRDRSKVRRGLVRPIRGGVSDGVEAVVIASTTETHFPIARDFLQRGVHVFVEKPITATPSEATGLIALAKKNRVVLQVGHLERFESALQESLPDGRDSSGDRGPPDKRVYG